MSRRAWAGLCLAAAVLWAVDAVVDRRWGTHEKDLATAAHVPTADRAARVGFLILAAKDGSPGSWSREQSLSAEGVDASRESLRLINGYLRYNEYRSWFTPKALAALRRGWALQWEPRRFQEALLTGSTYVPPDYLAFAAEMEAVPVTPEDHRRLDAASAAAARASHKDPERARRLYEAFIAAFAHFGDEDGAAYWLERRRGLYPLVREPAQPPAMEIRRDCSIQGRITGDSPLPTGTKVGLFALPWGTSRVSGERLLVSVVEPGFDGAFQFKDLTPGRYYLALRFAGGVPPAKVVGSPGIITLDSAGQRLALAGIQVRR